MMEFCIERVEKIVGKGENAGDHSCEGVLHGSVVKCGIHNLEAPDSSHTWSSGFFCGSVLWQDISES